MSASKLEAIFKPKSIAVIGASTKPGTVGNDLLANLAAPKDGKPFVGEVYPINPKADEILGKKVYKTVGDVPGNVDLAVLCLNAKFVLDTVDQCKAKGVKGLVIISAGFKESGKEGTELEKQLTDKVREAGIPLIGPNCLGVINPSINLNASFAAKSALKGHLGFVSQSGAFCTSVLDYAEARQLGFSKFVSFGNKADVSEIDILEYLADDPDTKVIAFYLESIGNAQKFIEAASKTFWEKGKPILCIKSGRSAEGAKAVSSHTGSLAGGDAEYAAIFKQSGVQRVDTISELFDLAALYTTQPLPKGNRLAIITNAGGPGIMATDAAIAAGLKLAHLDPKTEEALKNNPLIPDAAALHNPVDVIGDAHSDRYQVATEIVMADPNVDLGVIVLTPQSMTDSDNVGKILPEVIKRSGKPVVAAFMGVEQVAEGVKNLVDQGVPNYAFPEDAVKSLAAATKLVAMKSVSDRKYVEYKDVDTAKAAKVIADYLGSDKERYLTQAEARPLFEAYKLPLLKSGIAKSADEAAKIVSGIGSKVVLKVMSADVKHKFDAGGVILNVEGADGAKKAYEQIYANIAKNVPGAKIESVLIEQMAPEGEEVIVGCSRGGLGPLMMFGLGGTFVELIKDVQFRLAPMWKVTAEEMVHSIKAFKKLDGFRGTPKRDIGAVVDVVLRTSAMVVNHPEIAEFDINPLIVHAEGKGASVADS
ncbi:MAG: acetate--CoA ligase family protein, partial [Planctomycetaceae bacterium]|nr:acetate--CoA ligase family protein [Planctomycetaceae bacterium]